MKSMELPIENRREMKIMNANMQAIVDLTGPNLSSSVQLMIRKAINPPKIPKIAVDAPTVTTLGVQSTLRVKPEYINDYLWWMKQIEQLEFVIYRFFQISCIGKGD